MGESDFRAGISLNFNIILFDLYFHFWGFYKFPVDFQLLFKSKTEKIKSGEIQMKIKEVESCCQQL